MRKAKILMLATLSLTLFGGSSNGDEKNDVEPGTRVRVTAPASDPVAGVIVEKDRETLTVLSKEGEVPQTFTRPGRRTTGVLLEMTDETIRLKRSGDGKNIQIPAASVVKLEVSRAPGRKGFGAGLGASIGMGAAFVMAAILSSSNDDGAFSLNFGFGETALAGTLLFAPVGAAVGAIAAPGERWEVVASGASSLQGASNAGAGLSFTIRF